MLKGSFYTLNDLKAEGNSITAALELNRDHGIFKGHFPGQPVVPGVCLMEMTKEVLQEVLKKGIRLKKAANLKFISPVDPSQSSVLSIVLTYQETEESEIKVIGSMQAGDTVCFKFQELFGLI